MDISKVSKLDFFNFNINTAGSGQFEIVLKVGGGTSTFQTCVPVQLNSPTSKFQVGDFSSASASQARLPVKLKSPPL